MGKVILDMSMSLDGFIAGPNDESGGLHDYFFSPSSGTAEGELVAVHSHVRQKPGDLGAAVVHIFRFEKGRIVELWDLGQPVPEKSPNQYGMF